MDKRIGVGPPDWRGADLGSKEEILKLLLASHELRVMSNSNRHLRATETTSATSEKKS